MTLALTVGGHAVSLPGVVALGLLAGYVAGLFGVGGGFLLTPLLAAVFRVPMPIAVGTGLCQMIGTSFVAFLRHRRLGHGEPRFELLMLGGSIVGVDLGARALEALAAAGAVPFLGRRVPVVTIVLELAYVLLLLGLAARFWRRGRTLAEALDRPRAGPLARVRLGPAVDFPSIPLAGVSAVLVAQVGLALGFLSGLLGLGGGVLLLPVLVYGFGFPVRHAVATGPGVLLATSLAGTVLHGLRGHVDLALAMTLLVGSSVSAQLGALATRRLPAGTLRRAFALVLLTTAMAVLWDLTARGAVDH